MSSRHDPTERIAELQTKLDALKRDLEEQSGTAEPDGPAESGRPNEPDSTETTLSRRSLMGIGGMVGAGGLLGLSGAAVDTAAAVDYQDVTVADILTIEEKSGYNGTRVSFSDATSSNELLHMDTGDDSLVMAAGEAWFRGGSLNDIGEINHSAITGGESLTSLVGDSLEISNGELQVAGDTSGVSGETETALETIANPSSTAVIQTGSPAEAFHASNGWGPVFDVHAPTHLRGGLVAADASEYAEFAVYRMDDDPLNVDPSSPYRTREVPVDTGEQYVQLEMYLEPGVYHFTQRSETPMRRVDTSTDWASLNASDAPIEFIFGSWHYDRNPGHSSLSSGAVLDEVRAGNEDSILGDCNQDFADIFTNDWDSNLHYLADWDVGY